MKNNINETRLSADSPAANQPSPFFAFNPAKDDFRIIRYVAAHASFSDEQIESLRSILDNKAQRTIDSLKKHDTCIQVASCQKNRPSPFLKISRHPFFDMMNNYLQKTELNEEQLATLKTALQVNRAKRA